MKRLVILTVLCGTIFCACTADKNRAGNNLSTGSSIDSSTTGSIAAASGSTANVTEAAVKSNNSKKIQTDDIRTLRYANDKNIYLGDGDRKIYQYDLCGRRKKSYDLCKEMREKKTDYYRTEVLWVDNDSILFSCYREGYYCEIWRVPLTKKKNSLKMKEKEKIATKMEELDCLVTKTNEEVIYCADGKINKVNLKTKQKQVLKIGPDFLGCGIMKDRQRIPFVQDNKIYYKDAGHNMYQMDLQDWKPVYIGDRGGIIDFIEAEGSNLYYESEDNIQHQKIDENGDYRYYGPQEELVRYNFQTGKTVQLLALGKLIKEVSSLGETWEFFTNKLDWEKWDYSDIEAVYYHENRLYIAVRVTCDSEWEAWLMFSCQASDGSDFRFEKEVTEYLWKNSIPYQPEDDEAPSTDWATEHIGGLEESITGEFLYYLDGCIVMHFYDQEAEGDEDVHHRFVVYDISKRAFQEVNKYSKEYGYFKALGFSETDELVR